MGNLASMFNIGYSPEVVSEPQWCILLGYISNNGNGEGRVSEARIFVHDEVHNPGMATVIRVGDVSHSNTGGGSHSNTGGSLQISTSELSLFVTPTGLNRVRPGRYLVRLPPQYVVAYAGGRALQDDCDDFDMLVYDTVTKTVHHLLVGHNGGCPVAAPTSTYSYIDPTMLHTN